MPPSLDLHLAAHTKQADKALKDTTNLTLALGDATQELGEISQQTWDAQAKGVKSYGREIKKTFKELSSTQKAQGFLKEALSATPTGSILSQMKGLTPAKLTGWGASAAFSGALFATHKALQQEAVMQPLLAADPEGAKAISQANRQLGVEFGADANYLTREATRLAAAGFSSEQIMQVIRANVIAARGDVSKLQALMDEMVEAGTRGYLEESLLGKMDENSVALRTALQEHLGLTKEQLDAALSAGKVELKSYFDVIDKLTGEGSKAFTLAKASAETMLGSWERVKEIGEQCLAELGEGILTSLVDPVVKVLLPALEQLPSLLKDLKENSWGDVIKLFATPAWVHAARALTPQKNTDQFLVYEDMTPKASSPDHIKNLPALPNREHDSELQKVANDYARLQNSRQQMTREKSLSERATALGLSPSVTSADVERILASDDSLRHGKATAAALSRKKRIESLISQAKHWGLDENSTAPEIAATVGSKNVLGGEEAHPAGQWINEFSKLRQVMGLDHTATLGDMRKEAQAALPFSAVSLDRAEKLLVLQKDLQESERRIAEEKEKQQEVQKKLLADAKMRQMIQEAQLQNDKNGVALLQAQAEAEKLAETYRRAGISENQARSLAASEAARKFALSRPSSEKTETPHSSGWDRSHLAAVGGGGISRRVFEPSSLKTLEKTEKNTGVLGEVAQKILSFLEENALPAVLS